MISRNVAIITLLFAAVVPVLAQQAAPPAISLNVRLVALKMNSAVPEVYIQDPAGADTDVSIKSAIKSYLNDEFSALKLKGKKVVFTLKPDRGSMTRPGELLGELNLDEKVKSAILLFLPGEKNDLAKFRVLAIEDSRQKFPPGSYRIYNLSRPALRFVFSAQNYDFKGGFEDLVIEKPPLGPDMQVSVQFFALKEKQMQLMKSYVWPTPGETRTLLIPYPIPNTSDVDLLTINDLAPKVVAPRAR
jgi:hypothetical protein